MRKKLFFLLMALLALLPTQLTARDFTYTYEGQTLTYTVIDEDSKLCKTKAGIYSSGKATPGNNVSGVLSIPATAFDGEEAYWVSGIGTNGFPTCEISEIRFPDSEWFTNIGSYAFQDCKNLQDVILPPSLVSVYRAAFQRCPIKIAVAAETQVDSPSTNTNAIFIEYNSLSAVIEDDVIIQNDTLLFVSKKNSEYEITESDCEYEIPESVTAIGDYAFYGCSNLISIIIPETVTSIGENAFKECSNLFDVIIPNSVTSIGGRAFAWCSGLTSVLIGQSVASIGEKAFYNCTNLMKSAYPDALSNPFGNGIAIGYPAEDAIIEDNCVWGADKSGIYFVSLDAVGEFNIPNSVTEIGTHAFYGCHNLTSVAIPNSVTEIGDYAFYRCYNLTSVTIPDSITSINDHTFDDCSNLTSLTIPNSVTSIGNAAFAGCSRLSEVIIPNSVTSLGWHAFAWCSGLTSVLIGPSVASVGDGAFYNCTNLMKSAYPDALSNPFDKGIAVKYPAEDAIIEDGRVWGPEKSALYFVPIHTEGDFTVPNSVKTIGNSAFYGCSGLKSVTIPSSVTEIGKRALYGCSGLKTFTVEDGETAIEFKDEALYLVPIDSLYMGRNWTYTNNGAFSTNLKSVTLGSMVTSIPNYAFYFCDGLTEMAIPNSVTEIGEQAFYRCYGLKTFTVEDGETAISFHNDALYSAPIDSLYMGRSWTYTMNDAISTGLKSITLGNLVTSIPDYAFKSCSGLKEVSMPDSLTTIGGYAFSGCTGLISVILPPTVTSVGEKAFNGCTGLKKSVYPNTISSPFANGVRMSYPAEGAIIEDNCVWGADKSGIYFVPLAAEGEFTLPCSVKTVGESAFRDCVGLTSVKMPDSLATIGVEAFRNCSGITSITIPEPVTSIGRSAFDSCSGLTEVTMPNSVTSIGNSAFNGCAGLKEVSMPDSLTTIGGYAFSKCTGLISVILPPAVTSVGEKAFDGCTGLKKSVYPNTLSSPFADGVRMDYPAEGAIIEDNCVWGANKSGIYFVPLAAEGEFTLPGSVKTIGWSAFRDCTGLLSISIPDSVSSIEKYAFKGCAAINAVTSHAVIPPAIEESAFDTDTYANALLTIPDGSLNDYYSTTWGNFASMRVDGATENVAKFNDDVFSYIYSPGSGKAMLVPGNYSSLTNASIPNRIAIENGDDATFYQVTEIAEGAFKGYKGLKTVKLPKNLVTIHDEAFSGCSSLSEIEFPESIKTIGTRAFEDCSSLKTAAFAEGVSDMTIALAAFNKSGLTSIAIPQGVKTIGDYAFQECKSLSTVTIAEGVSDMTIGLGAFNKSGLTSIAIPERVKTIGDYAFSESRLTSVVVPDGVTTIGVSAFRECASLTSAKMGNGIKELPDSIFLKCEKLADLSLGQSLHTIGELALYFCQGLTSIDLPESLSTLKKGALWACSSLESLTLGNNLVEIGDFAFNSCLKITELTIPASVVSIGESAFSNCAVLETLTLADGIEPVELGAYMFKRINSEAKYESPVKKMHIGRDFKSANSFSGLSYLTDLAIGNTVTAVCDSAFLNCKKLATLQLGASLDSIGADAFKGCAITEVTVPPTVKSIGDNAFAGNKLTSLSIGYGIEEIGEKAFDGNNAIENIYVTAVNPPAANNNTFSRYESPLWLISKTAFDNYANYPRCWYRFEDNMYTLVPIEQLKAQKLEISGLPGDTIKLEVKIEPENATLQQIFWHSDRPDLVWVDNDGYVHFNDPENFSRAANECTITATTMYEDTPLLSFTLEVLSTGIETVMPDRVAGTIDYSAPYEVYNLNGMKVSNDTLEGLAHGIYIVRQGSVAKKIAVK